jgi:hypothetical protein
MNKLSLLLALAALIVIPSAAAYCIPVGYFGICIQTPNENLTSLYSESWKNSVVFGYYLPSGVPVNDINIRTGVELTSYELYVWAASNNTYLNGSAHLYYSCLDRSENITLKDRTGWLSAGAIALPITLYQGIADQTILSDTGEAAAITHSNVCSFEAYGQDLFIGTHFLPAYHGADLSGAFEIPDNAMRDITARSTDTISSTFDVIRMLIVVYVYFLLVFLLVTTWKLFEFFIHWVRRGSQ